MYYIFFLILLIIGLCLVSVSSFTKSLKNSRFLLNKCLIKPSLIYATNINRLEISTESSTQLDTFRSASTAKNPLEFIDALQKVSTTSGPGLQEVEAAIVMELLTPILSYIDNHSFIYCLHLINKIQPAKEYMQKHLKTQFLQRAIVASDELWKINDLERLLNELSKVGFESKDLPQEIIFNLIKRIEYSDMSFASMASVLRVIGAISLKDHHINTGTDTKSNLSNIIVNLIFDKMKIINVNLNNNPRNIVDFAGISKTLWGISRSNVKWCDIPDHVKTLVLHAFNEAADDVDYDNGATVRINSKDLCSALQAFVTMEADLLSNPNPNPINQDNLSFRSAIISLSTHQMSRMNRREVVNLCWALSNLGFKWNNNNNEKDDVSLRLKDQIMIHAKIIMHQMSPFDMESFVHAIAKMEVPVYGLEGGKLILQALEKMILSNKSKLNIFFIYTILDAVVMMGVTYEKSPILVKALVSMSVEKLHSFLPIQYGRVLNALSQLNVRFSIDDDDHDDSTNMSSSELILSQAETKRIIAVSARFLTKLPISSALDSIKGLERMRISCDQVLKEFKSKDDVKPSPSFKISFESYWKKRVLNMHHIPLVEFMEIAQNIGCEPGSFSTAAKQKTRTRFDSLAGKSFWTAEEQEVINKRFQEIGIFV